jgi:sulfite reductase (NADPH) hemoprotein beta-component
MACLAFPTCGLAELRPLFRAYREQRQDGEYFGDLLVRTGVVEAERTPTMLHGAVK